jgi:hypothetical protein
MHTEAMVIFIQFTDHEKVFQVETPCELFQNRDIVFIIKTFCLSSRTVIKLVIIKQRYVVYQNNANIVL